MEAMELFTSSSLTSFSAVVSLMFELIIGSVLLTLLLVTLFAFIVVVVVVFAVHVLRFFSFCYNRLSKTSSNYNVFDHLHNNNYPTLPPLPPPIFRHPSFSPMNFRPPPPPPFFHPSPPLPPMHFPPFPPPPPPPMPPHDQGYYVINIPCNHYQPNSNYDNDQDTSTSPCSPQFNLRKYEAEEGEESCAICSDSFEEGEFLHEVIPCGHKNFHPYCLDTWAKNNPTCPLCRGLLE